MTRRERAVVGSLVAASLLGLGALEAATRARQVQLMAVEPDAGAPSTPSGTSPTPRSSPLDALDRALGLGDLAGAERAWHAAKVAALRSRDWRALADIGDAALRVGATAGRRDAYVPRAREAYLAAVVSARAERSREGVTRISHAFRVLGDHELAQQCAIIADHLPAQEITATRVRDHAASEGSD